MGRRGLRDVLFGFCVEKLPLAASRHRPTNWWHCRSCAC